jgi:hypothetical protein
MRKSVITAVSSIQTTINRAQRSLLFVTTAEERDTSLKHVEHEENLEKLQTQDFTPPPDKRRQSRWDENKQRKQQAKAFGISLNESNTESSEEENYVYAVSQETRYKTHATVKINAQDVLFLVDTGATVDIIDSTTYAKLKRKSALRKSSTKIYAYGFQTPLLLNGQFHATLESKKRYTVSQIYVIDGTGGNLLGAKTAQDLALVQLINTISGFPEQDTQAKTNQDNTHSTACDTNPAINTSVLNQKTQNTRNHMNKYSTVFKGQGKLINQQTKLHIRDNVKPVMQWHRRTPYHVRNDVSKELKKLGVLDIVEKVVNQPTPRISLIVVAPKKYGGMCRHEGTANQAIEREGHTMPTLQDFKAEVNEAKFFANLT